MIADNIKNANLYPVSERIKKALDFLKGLEGKNPAECGFGAAGDEIYALYSTYENEKNPPVFEAHKKYIDVQYIVSGKETFGWKTLDTFPDGIYNPDKDCALFSENDFGTFTLGAGDFVVFFPVNANRFIGNNVFTCF